MRKIKRRSEQGCTVCFDHTDVNQSLVYKDASNNTSVLGLNLLKIYDVYVAVSSQTPCRVYFTNVKGHMFVLALDKTPDPQGLGHHP